MDSSTARAPETRALWKEALEGSLGKELNLPFDQDIFTVVAPIHSRRRAGWLAWYTLHVYQAGNSSCCMALPLAPWQAQLGRSYLLSAFCTSPTACLPKTSRDPACRLHCRQTGRLHWCMSSLG